jgi:hypothetical protein
MSSFKVGVIWVENSINVGDDVQTLAMQEIVKRCHPEAEVVWCDRESLHKENSAELSHLIVSGWFMKEPDNWPVHPSYPKPLFISFHVNREQKVDLKLISESHRDFWLENAPIGCRDKGTRDQFSKLSIDAWFSGCATLTFQREKETQIKPYILVADPFYHIYTKSYEDHQLKRLFGKSPKLPLKVVTNADSLRPQKSKIQRLQETQDLISTIRNAQFVVTSRIHIALPATAMGVPVYFISSGYNRTEHSRDRFEGLLELFHIVDERCFPFSSRKRLGKLFRLLRMHKFVNTDLSSLIADKPTLKDLNSARAIASKIEQAVQEYLN